MPEVIIIGAGLSGLSAAAYLCKSSIKPLILESSGKPGGRAFSYIDRRFNMPLDNGQHIMMGCYEDTFGFLKLIGSFDKLNFQNQLKINFLLEGGEVRTLQSGTMPYPMDLISAFLKFDLFDKGERLNALKAFIRLPFINSRKISDLTVYQWLRNLGQSERLIWDFWEVICIGALNISSSEAPAGLFVDMMKRIFLSGSDSYRIVLPGRDLSSLYADDAVKYICSRGGEISYSSGVDRIEVSQGRVSAVVVNGERIEDFKYVISAVPPYAFNRLIAEQEEEVRQYEFGYSPIVSVHIQMKQPVKALKEKFYALTGSPVHWVFVKDGYLSTVTSGAKSWEEKSTEEIGRIVVNELKKHIPGLEVSNISNIKVIREKRATVVFTKDNVARRPKTLTALSNLILAGDWTDTGLPATIESAVKSGRLAAEYVTQLNM